MTAVPRLAVSLVGAALTAAGAYYLGKAEPWAAAGGATAVFLVLFVRLKRTDP